MGTQVGSSSLLPSDHSLQLGTLSTNKTEGKKADGAEETAKKSATKATASKASKLRSLITGGKKTPPSSTPSSPQARESFRSSLSLTAAQREALSEVNHSPRLHNENSQMANLAELEKEADGEVFLSDAKGRLATSEFDKNGTVIADIVCKREDTVDILHDSLMGTQTLLQNSRTSLQNEKSQLEAGSRTPESEAKLEHLDKQLAIVEKKLAKVEEDIGNLRFIAGYDAKTNKLQSHWASTNASRDVFKMLDEMAKTHSLAVLGNLRTEVVNKVDSQGKVQLSSIVRSACPTDFTHGETNFREMRDLHALRALRNGETVSPETLKRLNTSYQILDNQGNLSKESLENHIEEIKQRIETSYGKGSASIESIDQAISSRENYLKQQFLQDVVANLKSRPQTGDQAVMTRLGLLDTIKKANVVKDGPYLYEKNQALDAKELYEIMDGKKLIFGDYALPCFDQNGNICLPKELKADFAAGGVNGENQVTLRALFMNISIQVDLDNEGAQKIINDEALSKLEELAELESDPEKRAALEAGVAEIREALAKYEKDGGDPTVPKKNIFDIVDSTVALFQKSGFYISINCYGGKDRTGVTAAHIAHRALAEADPKPKPEDFASAGEFKKATDDWETRHAKFGRQIFNDITRHVVKDNAGIHAVKIFASDIPLFRGGKALSKVKSFATQAGNLGNVVRAFIPGAVDEKLMGEGRLYSIIPTQ